MVVVDNGVFIVYVSVKSYIIIGNWFFVIIIGMQYVFKVVWCGL